MKRRQIAWILILSVDVAYVAWDATAAVMSESAGQFERQADKFGFRGNCVAF